MQRPSSKLTGGTKNVGADRNENPLAAGIRAPSARTGTPRVLVDHVGMVAEFLNEVDLIDVVVELIQNELDAGSPQTELDIGDDMLICTGAGDVMDDKGWERLGYVLGAGALVEAKLDGIGSKNHGIRACFLLGDQITVQSDGCRADLTAKGDTTDPNRFYPAGWERELDPDAPSRGVRVIVPMREQELPIPGHSPLAIPSAQQLDGLFEETAQTLPERLLGASAPNRHWRYEVVLRRRRRIVRLVYEARPGGAGAFTLRTCHRSEAGRPGRLVARRACHAFVFTPEEGDVAKVPRLFRDGEKILGEICWSIDATGRPIRSAGTHRYPIALPAEQGGNPHGFDISGPFVTGKARHALSKDQRNDALLKAAAKAFVSLMRDALVPGYGPDALDLLQSTGPSDPQRVAMLAGALLEAGALPLAAAGSANRKRKGEHSASKVGGKVQLPGPTYRYGALDAALVALAPAGMQLLDSASPTVAVTALRIWARDNPGVAEFTEVNAARTVMVDEAPEEGEQERGWIERCLAALKMLDLAHMNGTLDAAALTDLKKDGWLPMDDGRAYDWLKIRQAKIDSLRIPGVEPPPLLHPKLKGIAVLRRGPAMVSRFDLDKFLSGLTFEKAGERERLAFFRWLRKNHGSLQPKTLAVIANYPVWPDTANVCRPLSSYCVPRKSYLREALASVMPMPGDKVTRFPGLRAASNAALRLRVRPNEDELRQWHCAAMARIATMAEKDKSAAARMVHETEAVLDRMREDDHHPRHFAQNHLSLDQTGEIRSIAELHVDTAAVTACALLPQDLLPANFRTLHVALGAQVAPLPEAVLRTLRSDADRSQLAARLLAYRNAGRPLGDLASEPIVREQDESLAPDTLAFLMPVDHWGQWKRRISLTEVSPEEAKLLEDVGVVRAPREESARDFFAWLRQQSSTTLAKHRSQIVRLWLDRRASPVKWYSSYPHLACVLLRDGKKQASLIAPRAAAGNRVQVYLPDFRAIEGTLMADHPRLRLAVVDCEGVDGSALHAIAEAGVKSLAAEVGPPCRLTLIGDARPDASLEAELEKARSSRVRNHLKAALPRHGVPGEALDRRWRSTLQEIRGVQIAPNLEAVYEFRRRSYPAPVSSGHDIATGQICVAEANASLVDLYDAIAGRIFVAGSPATYSHGLLHAVRELSAAPSGRTLFDDLQGGETEAGGEPEEDGDNREYGGDNRKGHGMPADAQPFVPTPNALGKLTNLTFPQGSERPKPRRRPSKTDEQRHSIEEDAQIQKLKHDHYALHCQACIGAREVLEAAPPESYVYGPSFRRLLIQAHHVKLLANEAKPSRRGEVAGQGAGNLLILCRYHHALLGDHLSRAMVLEGLATATTIKRHFPDKAGALTARSGLLATVKIARAPHQVELFFTRQHWDAWLEY